MTELPSITPVSIVTADQQIYALARTYLFALKVPGLTPEIIHSYLQPYPNETMRPATLAAIYLGLLESIQNANMKAGVIGKAIGGVKNLQAVLCAFEPRAVCDKYQLDAQRLLTDIMEQVRPHGQIRQTPRSIWPQYCRAILSGAQFLAHFATADAFYAWCDTFQRDDEWAAALPLLLSEEIRGLGFALACDWLKELGYVNFAKPDVHLREIFGALGLCASDAGDYTLFKSIVRVAKHVQVSAYHVDKLFWLIGSGYFYNHPHLGKGGKIGSQKEQFIAFALAQRRG